MPDDVMVYGYLADANTELGNYDAAVKAIQWMLNIKPGNIAGLTRAAYQRELHGDISGAMELMQMAYDATPYQEFEDRAWILTQMSHLSLVGGDLPKAESFATERARPVPFVSLRVGRARAGSPHAESQ